MQLRFTDRAVEDYSTASPAVKKALAKQLDYLLNNIQHPSLNAKKFDARDDIWQARVNLNWRFYFKIVGNEYIILSIIPHPK